MSEKNYALPVIGIVLSGSFEYRTMDCAATAVPGALILGNQGEAFSCVHLERGGNRRQVAEFATPFLHEIAGEAGMGEPKFRAGVAQCRQLAAQAFGLMRRLANSQDPVDEDAYELAGLALQSERSFVPTTRVSPRNRHRIVTVVAHLESHFNRPWTLQQLAALVPLSPYHFLRLFKSVVGQSPAQYILHARLRAAANRLLASRAPVAEVALQTGFNDISHFNACFRRQFGSSPTRWRA